MFGSFEKKDIIVTQILHYSNIKFRCIIWIKTHDFECLLSDGVKIPTFSGHSGERKTKDNQSDHLKE